jgi:hypothetical protein
MTPCTFSPSSRSARSLRFILLIETVRNRYGPQQGPSQTNTTAD